MTTTASTRDIMDRLPHRYPFLFVDRVIDGVPGEWIRAVKNVTANEPYFAGHFPGEPVMPGVLIVEALAQAGGLNFDVGDRLCVLARIDGVRFRGLVRPGDQLILEARVVAALATMGKATATASVDGKTVVTAEVTYSFIERGTR